MKNNELIAQDHFAQLFKGGVVLVLLAAIYGLFWVAMDPYFVYFEIPRGVEAIIVACFMAIPWSWYTAVSNLKTKRLAQEAATKAQDAGSEKVVEPPKQKYMALFWCACVAFGIYLLIHEADRLDQINHFNRAKQQVTDAVERDCVEKCPNFGITQTALVGPRMVHTQHFEPHSGKHDDLFEWHSTQPVVRITGRVRNVDDQGQLSTPVIDLKWFGKILPPPVVETAADFEPHYTAMRRDFNEVIEDAKPEINNAFMRAKLSAPKIQGKITVHLMINTYGQVTAANIDSSELENADFENNLIFIIKGLEFESGEFADMDKNYTFNFK